MTMIKMDKSIHKISEEIIYKHTENMPNVFIPYSKDCNDDLKLANLIGNDHINNEMIKNFLERMSDQESISTA
ncbi:hypothetical protein HpMS51_10150 [Helicobacter pylori]